MGERRHHRKYLLALATSAVALVGVSITLVIPSYTQATSPVMTYANLDSKNFYQSAQYHPLVNASGAGFQSRDEGSSFGSSDGGYSMAGGGGYGAPAMPSPSVYKYEIHPVSRMHKLQ